jgi:hypothetical protein
MKQILFIVLICLISKLSFAQDSTVHKWYHISKNDITVYSLQALSGNLDGIHEQIIYHPAALLAQFPTLDPSWWDSRISWQNKNHMSPLLIDFSDANHFFRGAILTVNCLSLSISSTDFKNYRRKDFFKRIGEKLLFSAIANKIGFASSYYLIFNNK